MSTAAEYCNGCWRPRGPGELLCLRCHCSSWSSGWLDSPNELSKAAPFSLPWPWDLLGDWQPGTLVAVSGGPGSGKSSLAARLPLDWWVTSESNPDLAGLLLARCCLGELPAMNHQVTCEGILQAVHERPAGSFGAIDSITAAGGWAEQGVLIHDLAEWTRATSSRLLIIIQENGAGVAAGLNELKHHVDAVGSIDRGIVRSLSFSKNRMGDIGTTIFGLGAKGAKKLDLSGASYSVEGEPGGYELHPYPMAGGKWGKIFREAWGEGDNRPGFAAAAIPVRGYPDGLLRPLDWEERQRFAVAQGLKWAHTISDLQE